MDLFRGLARSFRTSPVNLKKSASPRRDRVRRAAEAAAVVLRHPIEPLERRVLISGSAPLIGYARSAPGNDPRHAALLARVDNVTAGHIRSAVVLWGDGALSPVRALDLGGVTALFAEHTYASAGRYEARIIASGADGREAAKTIRVRAYDQRPAKAETDADEPLTSSSPSSLLLETDTTPPKVSAVYVDGVGSATLAPWDLAYRQLLADQTPPWGSTTLGFAVPDADAGYGTQLESLPWSNGNVVRIAFDEPVTVDDGDLAVRGVTVPQYTLTGFNYDPATRIASWTLSEPPTGDRLVLDLNGDSAGGVTDTAGNRLAGSWNSPASSFPSGPAAGADFRFHLNRLPGDVNGNGSVDGTDFSLLSANFGLSGKHHRQGDLTGDAWVNGSDFSILAGSFGRTVPATPLAPTDLTAVPFTGFGKRDGLEKGTGLEKGRLEKGTGWKKGREPN